VEGVLHGRAAMTQARVALGKTGEDLACSELEGRGYEIIARRYRQRSGELDIVARDGPTLVFIEVKARDGSDFGDAAEAVTWRKRHRLTLLAIDFMSRNHIANCPCRFDVVTVQLESGRPAVTVYQNAFDATVT
jgi:putative endonuclease